MDSKMQALRDRFVNTGKSSTTSNYYQFYKIPTDASVTVRFLPDKNTNNPMGFLIERLSHTLLVNGEKKTVPCLTQYGDDCPICKVARDFYAVDDKVNGKAFYKNRSFIGQVLLMDDPIVEPNYTSAAGTVKPIQLGYSIFKIIKDAFESGELDTPPFSFQDGTNFMIKKTKQGEFASYTLSKFARKSTDLTPEQEELALKHSIDLSTVLPPKPDLAFVNKLLEAALTGKSMDSTGDGDEDESDAFAMMAQKAKHQTATTTATTTSAVADSDDDAEKSAEELLREITRRRQQASSE